MRLFVIENVENFNKVLNYLKLKYNFNPTYITSDFQKAQIKYINIIFPKSNIILCWFHALQNIKKKFHFLIQKIQ